MPVGDLVPSDGAPPPPPTVGPGGGPPPPPPPPTFKKLSGKLNITKSENKPKPEGQSNVSAKLIEEIARGVALRKTAVRHDSPNQSPVQSDTVSLFSLGSMASDLARKR